jgi:hypothetical protein
VLCPNLDHLAEAQVSPNPANPFLFALGNNIYQTKNYFIAAYHYVQCYGTDLVVPSSTADVAQAMAHYYKLAQVGTRYTGTLTAMQTTRHNRTGKAQLHAAAAATAQQGATQWAVSAA